MSKEDLVIVPEKHLLRLLTAAGARRANKSEQTYAIGVSHFEDLLGECAKKHKCKGTNDAHCVCSREVKL